MFTRTSRLMWSLFAIAICFVSRGHATTIDASTVIDSPIAAGEAVKIIDGFAGPTVVDMIDGGVMGADVEVYGSSVFNHRGGVSHGAIEAFEMSTINLFGGRIGDGEHVVVLHNGTLNVFGGEIVTGLEGGDNGEINILGGSDTYSVALRGSSIARVYGTSLRFDETTRVVTGNFLDGSPVNVEVNCLDDSAQLLLVPEPSYSFAAFIGCMIVSALRRTCPVQDRP